MTRYFAKGYSDATDIEESLQIVGVDTQTLEVCDTEGLIFRSDLPKLHLCTTFDEVVLEFENRGWRLEKI